MITRFLSFVIVAVSVVLVSFSGTKVGAQDAPKSSSTSLLPDVEATQKKVAIIKEGASELKELFDKLKELGDPATRKDNESDQQYVGRAERILKGRALYVHFAHQEMQRILEARFGAEMVLDDYDRWVTSRLKALKMSANLLGDEAKRIENDRKDFGFNSVVLAKLISDDAEFLSKKEKEVKDNPSAKTDFDNLSKAIKKDIGVDGSVVKKIVDMQIRSDKYKALSTEDKIKKYYDSKKGFKDADFEFSYISKAVIPENQKFSVSLPKAHANILNDLKVSLAANKALFEQLDDNAFQLSVIARYTRENLGLVSSIKDVTEATDALVKVNSSEKSIKEMLTKFLSLPGQLSTDFVGKSLTGDVSTFVDQFEEPMAIKPEAK